VSYVVKPLQRLAAIAAVCLISCASTTSRQHLPPLQTVAQLDLPRYMGTWYEIASIPQFFQRGCTGTRATYTLQPEGHVQVVNACRRGDPPQLSQVTGRARLPDPAHSAKLEVSFFRPFWGDYWVIALAEDYTHAAVGSPGRDSLWILSRTPTLPEPTYQALLQNLSAQHYDVTRLQRTQQP
jgi:apolipoprotein D and lipocalin family protein